MSPHWREGPVLAALALGAAAVWGFIEIADEALEGEVAELDRKILLAFRGADGTPLGASWLQEMLRDFTALGGIGVLAVVTLAATGYLLLDRKRHAALAVLLAVIGGQVLGTLLKLGFDRERPDLVPHAMHACTASFPSGHSMMAAVTYLTLGALLAGVHRPWRLKLYFVAIALALTGVVGLSRVYLGVHWPSDVLAGWSVGVAWACLCWAVMRALQRRGAVEPETP